MKQKKERFKPITFFKFKNLFYNPIRAIKDLSRDMKNFIHRGRYGWADLDWFNLDDYLMNIIPDMLEELAERGCGYSESFIDANGDRVDNRTPEDWKNYLLEIAQHFRNADENQTPIENSISDDKDAWFKQEREILEWRLSEAQKGLKMLGDNFFSLWD